jgi:AcrR family transcriptional regulator
VAAESSTRRPTSEVRELIIRAATREFARGAYDETTMRAVAERAGISLSVLHHHFPSKDELFVAAALVPFLSFFEEFAASWETQVEEPWNEESLMGELVRGLYRHLGEHRSTVARLASLPPDSELADRLRDGLAQVVAGLHPIGEHEAAVRGWFSPDVVDRTVTMTLTLVTGIVLMRPWLEVAEDELLDTATRYVLYGIRLERPERSSRSRTEFER